MSGLLNPPIDTIVNAIRRVQADLSYTSYPNSTSDLREYFEGDRGLHRPMFELTSAIFSKGNLKLKRDSNEGFRPKTAHGKSLLADLQTGPYSFYDKSYEETVEVCEQTEPRLVRSLGFHSPDAKVTHRLPAIILTDGDGQPIAYQKSSGTEAVYFWERAEVETAEGIKAIPADSFGAIEIDFEGVGIDPCDYQGPGLITLEANPRTLLTAGFLRKSATTFPPSMRRAMAYEANLGEKQFDSGDLVGATTFTPASIQKQVFDLAKSGIAEMCST